MTEGAPPQEPSRRERARRSLLLDDDALWLECDWQAFTAGGPGGQHRNKTQSAVRLVHLPTGVTVSAGERRSQLMNRNVALERLRAELKLLSFVPKPRKETRPSRSAKRRRVENKRHQSQKKKDRRGEW